MTSQTRLVYVDDKSRKFWNATLADTTLLTQWGRIGTDGQTKTAEFADAAKAQAAYEKAVREKRTKGYTDADGAGPLDTVAEALSVPAIRPMLALEVPTDTAESLIANDAFSIQQKMDGDRVMVSVDDAGNFVVLGRSGQTSKHSPRLTNGAWAADLSRLRNVTIDGELVGDVLHVFDLPERAEVSIDPDKPYWARRAALEGLFAGWNPDESRIRLLGEAKGAAAKREWFERCVAVSAEGVIFKHETGTYQPGRRADHMVKIKFVADADCVVSAVGTDGKDNFELGLYSPAGDLIPVGRASAIGKERCEAGDVVVVRYLYASADNQLVQPRVLHRRTDKAAAECVVAQLDGHHVNKEAMA